MKQSLKGNNAGLEICIGLEFEAQTLFNKKNCVNTSFDG